MVLVGIFINISGYLCTVLQLVYISAHNYTPSLSCSVGALGQPAAWSHRATLSDRTLLQKNVSFA